MADNDGLLYGSQELTDEEKWLRRELMEWCQVKLNVGHRPIPIQVALQIVSNRMQDPETYGLVMGGGNAEHDAN